MPFTEGSPQLTSPLPLHTAVKVQTRAHTHEVIMTHDTNKPNTGTQVNTLFPIYTVKNTCWEEKNIDLMQHRIVLITPNERGCLLNSQLLILL